MIELSDYGVTVVNNFNLIGMWIAVTISCRNFFVCLQQYKRTRGKIHLVNLAQVSVFFIHRVLYGIIPLFEIQTCAYFPLLVSLWHITYILFYIVMFMRLLILEQDRNSRWIKIVGALLITLRFADWPYELAFHTIQEQLMGQAPQSGSQCWAQWGAGVIILNFVGDALANLFLSGMFVRRLFIHMRTSKSVVSLHNKIIERIAKKSLICLALTFFVNLAMNLLKVTNFLGDHSDAFTVYFEIIESTLLVEALCNDNIRRSSSNTIFCANCNREFSSATGKTPNDDDHFNSQMLVQSFNHNNSHKKTKDNNRLSDISSFINNDNNFDMHSLTTMKPAILFDNHRKQSEPYLYNMAPSNEHISIVMNDTTTSVDGEKKLSLSNKA